MNLMKHNLEICGMLIICKMHLVKILKKIIFLSLSLNVLPHTIFYRGHPIVKFPFGLNIQLNHNTSKLHEKEKIFFEISRFNLQ